MFDHHSVLRESNSSLNHFQGIVFISTKIYFTPIRRLVNSMPSYQIRKETSKL